MKKMVGRIGLMGGIAAFFLFLETSFVKAQTLTDPLGGKETFISVANDIAHFLLYDIAIPLSVIMVLVGAFQFITGGGDPAKISEARKTILYAAIGLGVALIAGGITSLIKSILPNGS